MVDGTTVAPVPVVEDVIIGLPATSESVTDDTLVGLLVMGNSLLELLDGVASTMGPVVKTTEVLELLIPVAETKEADLEATDETGADPAAVIGSVRMLIERL